MSWLYCSVGSVWIRLGALQCRIAVTRLVCTICIPLKPWYRPTCGLSDGGRPLEKRSSMSSAMREMHPVGEVGQVELAAVHGARDVCAVEIAGVIHAIGNGVDQRIVVYRIGLALDHRAAPARSVSNIGPRPCGAQRRE